MRFIDTQKYLKNFNLPLMQMLQNGECRFLALSEENETDSTGFANPVYSPRTVNFLGCVWTGLDNQTLSEVIVSSQTRALVGYSITLMPLDSSGETIEFKQTDKIELKLTPGAESGLELEIAQVINESGVSWQITAIDIDA